MSEQSLYHNVVGKLWKMRHKIISTQDIKKIVGHFDDSEISDAKIYKLSYHLRNKGHILTLKKNHFLVTSPNDIPSSDEIIAKYYRDMLKKHCQTYIQWGWYIGGMKALEFALQQYDIPESIDVVTTHKNACEIIIFDKSVCYKTYNHNKTNLFSHIKKYITTIKIGKYSFPCASLELALLESLHNPSAMHATLIYEYAKKILRKYKKALKREHIDKIVNGNKHHVWLNRLYYLSKTIDTATADKILSIIKKHSFLMQQSAVF